MIEDEYEEAVPSPQFERGQAEGLSSWPGGDVVVCELGMDVAWGDFLQRLGAALETPVTAKTEEEAEVVRRVERRDFERVGVVWKRREGAASLALHARDLWTRRVLGVLDGSLRYYATESDEWDAPRGAMSLGEGFVARYGDSAAVQETLSSPTAWVMEVTRRESSWLVCFESGGDMDEWMRAIARAQRKPEPRRFHYALRSAVAVPSFRRRVVACRRIVASEDVEAAISDVARRLDESADVAMADVLAARDRGEPYALLSLDPHVLADTRRWLWAAARRELVAFSTEAMESVGREAERLGRLASLVRPAYASARLVLPDASLDLAPLEAARAAACDDDDDEELPEAASAVAENEVADIVDRAFAGPGDVAAACRFVRRTLAARAATLAATAIRTAAVEPWRDARRKRVAEAANACGRRATAAKIGLVAAATEAVRAGAWIGPDGPSANLWQRFEAAATQKQCALASFAVTVNNAAATLWVCALALYVAPSKTLAGRLFSKALGAVSGGTGTLPPTGLVVPTRVLSQTLRVPSPVPLKNNALELVYRPNSRLVLTLNAPGASISTLIDLIDACRRLSEDDDDAKRDRLAEFKARAPPPPSSEPPRGDVELGSVDVERTGLRASQKQDFMGSFFGDVDEVKRGIEVVDAAAKRIRGITEERLLAVSPAAEEALTRELTPLVDRANQRMKATKENLEKMAAETDRNRSKMKGSEVRIRDNLVTTLHRKFGDVCKEYQRQQQNYKTEIQKTVKRRLEIVKPDISNEEIDAVLRTGATQGVYRSAILKGAADPIKAAYADVADKYQDVLRLEQSVAELHQMFLDFALLTEQQGELLDQIEYQVKSANEYIEDGNKDIEVAIVYQKEIRKKWCCIIAILLVIIGVVVLYVYLSSSNS
ncbi:hypothetical protein CTAYLR_005520 [Chrysophaeum taylorii]|uniref:t-SNARE coiled-coil homology domain-containing protein n=1 Tax=Chrysophaeum taylorii TaxID=2483200 RepID=A0AAD7U4J5_9STRA|nr:hypothetical protein CTAYLR_005520 [Chrysophaeum taylorii]